MLLRAFILYFLSGPALAGNLQPTYWLYSEAVSAEQVSGIDRCLIVGVLSQEAGTPGADKTHANGVVDSGMAQVRKNGEWMRYLHREFGITHDMIRDNPYLAPLIVGHILMLEYSRSGEIVQAVGAYHRGTGRRDSVASYQYAAKVFERVKKNAQQGVCR